jgi:pentapeptide MXKDX repeat protein
MDKIMNTLPDNHISNETLWIYKDNIEIFNKYNQQVNHTIKKDEIKKDEIKKEKTTKDEIKKDEIKKDEIKKEEIKKDEIKKDEIKKNEIKKEEIKKEEIKKEKTTKKMESPIDLILRLTLVDKIMKQDIKDKLIEFISVPEFSKVFGMKKTSEIMTAISKESWNQSISLFISFLLNKNIIYKDKSYIYNKDKEISQQSIIIS